MLKALIIFFGILALGYAASVGTASDASEVCQSQDELWGGEDIRKFYFCLDGKVIADECDSGYYFVNNATISGCLPSDLMKPSCVNLDTKVPDCTGTSKLQPQAADDVASFYLCTSEGATLLSCPDGKAFVSRMAIWDASRGPSGVRCVTASTTDDVMCGVLIIVHPSPSTCRD
uniref:RE16426p n=1 Tax=Drosophila melanogaster TaxID=7227 RepID=Q8SZ55_DROME|nr:RE16426p [Drosophila melanogaster]